MAKPCAQAASCSMDYRRGRLDPCCQLRPCRAPCRAACPAWPSRMDRVWSRRQAGAGGPVGERPMELPAVPARAGVALAGAWAARSPRPKSRALPLWSSPCSPPSETRRRWSDRRDTRPCAGTACAQGIHCCPRCRRRPRWGSTEKRDREARSWESCFARPCHPPRDRAVSRWPRPRRQNRAGGVRPPQPSPEPIQPRAA